MKTAQDIKMDKLFELPRNDNIYKEPVSYVFASAPNKQKRLSLFGDLVSGVTAARKKISCLVPHTNRMSLLRRELQTKRQKMIEDSHRSEKVQNLAM